MATSRRRLSFLPSADGNTADNQGIICSLCLAPHTQMSTPLSWKSIQAQDIALTRLHLTHESHVCRLCWDDISRLVKSPHMKPRWEKTGRKLNCCVPMCTSTSFSTTQIASGEEIAHILSCENLPHPTPLCKQHYHLVYDSLRSKQTHCCTCNSTIRSGRKCICPDPQRVQQYLEKNTGFEATIPENGRVCTPCYEAQLVILKEDTVSTDDDLRSLISELKESLLSIGNIKSEDDILNQATYGTAIYVGERQQCLLLPSVNETFSFVSELACASNLHVEGKFKGRWILSNLVVCLQHHLSYTCKVRKHGTLLYRSNGDLLVSLSHLVYKSRHARCDHDEKLRTS